MAIKIDNTVDQEQLKTQIALAQANGGVFAIETTKDIYITEVTENVSKQSVTNIVNSPSGALGGELQFADGRGFASTNNLRYTDAMGLSLRGNMAMTGNLNLTGSIVSSGLLNLGSPTMVKITGGSPGYVLATDGNGNLEWVSAAGATYSNANVTDYLPTNTANIGAGNAALGNLVVANFYAGVLTTNAQPNITSVGPLVALAVTGTTTTGALTSNSTITATGNIFGGNLLTGGNISGLNLTINNMVASGNLTLTRNIVAANVTANHFGDGGNLTNINGANIIGGVTTAGSANFANVANSVAGANVTGTVANAARAIVSDSTLSVPGLGVVGNVNTAVFAYTAGVANSVDGANVVGNVTSAVTANFANYAGNVTVNAQPNITSVGTLTSLTVGGLSNLGPVGNLTIAGGSAGQTIVTDGAGNLSWATVAGGTDSNLANFAGNVTVAAQPNITSVGNLTGLNVDGISNLGSNGNVKITGGVIGQVLSTDGAGNLVWTTVNDSTASNGTSSTEVNAGNVTTIIGGTTIQTIAVNGVTITGNANVSGNVAASYFIGNGSQLTDITGANIVGDVTSAITANFANYAGNVTVAAQPNITSVGNLTGFKVDGISYLGPNGNVRITGGTTGQVLSTDGTGVLSWTTISATGASNGTSGTQVNAGNITNVIGGTTIQTIDGNGVTITGNANVSGNVAASYFIGDGSQLTNITGSNIVGNVTSAITANFANYAGNITVNAQPNITSVGNLTGLNVNGIANLGPNSNVRITGGTSGQFLTTDGTGVLSWATVSASGASNGSSGTQVNASNITNVIGGTTIQTVDANGVTITGNANVSGNVNASYFVGDGSQLTNITGSNIVGNVTSAITANFANYAGNITVNAQPNITSVGTLTGITSTGTANFINASNVSLGPVANIHITGGNPGDVLTTDGSSGLSWQPAAATYGDANVALYLPTHTGNVGAGNIALSGTTSRIDAAGTIAILPSVGNTVDLGNTRLLFDITPVNAQGGNVGTTALPFFEGHFINVFGEAGNLSNIQGANVVGDVTSAVTANFANFAGNVTEAAQPNITSVGTLTSLAVSGTTNLGAVGNVTITGGTTGQVLSTDGSGVLSWATAASGASYYDMKTNVIAHEVQYRDYDTGLGGSAPTVTVTTRADASALKPGDILQLLVYNGIANKPTGTLVEYVWTRDTVTGVYLWSRNVTLNSDNTISIQSYKTPMFDRSGQTSISFMYATQSYTVSTATVFTASNLPVSGSVASTTLVLTISNNSTITWPTGTRWPSGTPPTLGNGTHVVSMMTYDGGTTFLAAALTSYA